MSRMTNGMPYSSRPENVEAATVTEETGVNLAVWSGGSWDEEQKTLSLPTFEGTEHIESGSYLVKDLNTGRFRGMTAESFEKRYDHSGTGDSGEDEYTGMQFESEEDLQAHNQRK